MTGLRLDHFIHAAEDFEGAQYRILGELQQARQAFTRNVIYPHLGELIKLHRALLEIIQQMDNVRNARPGALKGIDLEASRLVYEKPMLDAGGMEIFEDLIRWSLPHVQQVIDEGGLIFDFVEDNIHLEEVGIVPSYIEEGYLMLADPQKKQLHILQYALSVLMQAKERFRSLKTAHVKSISQRGIYPSPQSLKLALLSEKRDLPNPATYFFATDLDFPFEQTILPVAKRKLIRYLFRRGEMN